MKNPLIRIFILLLVLTFAVLVSRGVFGATITANFPTSLDSWSDGDIIEDEDIEALQVKIGIDSSAVATSLDYLIKNTSSKLGKIASLAVTDSNIIVGDGTNWVAESGATARTSLGLGTGDSPSFTGLTLSGDLTVTGGDITLGTTSIFSGGDTASLNNIDAVDATTETPVEAAIDTLANLTGLNLSQTNLTAGRSLTLSTNDVLADAELYTDTKCIFFENPAATDDFKSIWFAKQAVTLTSLWCESDQTVNAMVQDDDGTPSDADTVDLACDTMPPEDTALDGDATLAAGDRFDLDIASVSGGPTFLSLCWTFTYDD